MSPIISREHSTTSYFVYRDFARHTFFLICTGAEEKMLKILAVAIYKPISIVMYLVNGCGIYLIKAKQLASPPLNY